MDLQVEWMLKGKRNTRLDVPDAPRFPFYLDLGTPVVPLGLRPLYLSAQDTSSECLTFLGALATKE